MKRKFVEMLNPFGDGIVQKFFVQNPELLLPPVEEIRAAVLSTS